MKVLNIFLSILILLLAVASAVFSFFLYEKRYKLVDGWDKMAKAINASAVNLDKGSGTDVAKTLSVSELGHDKYDSLDSKLPKLKEHAGQIVTERDNMASALKKIAETVEMDNVQPLKSFQGLTTYKSNTSAVVEKVQNVTEQQNSTLREVCNIANKLNADLTFNRLKGSTYSSELDKFANRVNSVNSLMNQNEGQFKKIYSVAGGSEALDFSDNSYSRSTGKVVSAVRTLKSKYLQSQDALKTRTAKVSDLEGVVKSKDGAIAKLNEDMQKKDIEINRLNRIIMGDKNPDAKVDPWENGSKEARTAVQGKVIKVDRKYGFVVVDLGVNTTVKQTIGTKTNYANPMIPVDSKMIVVRDIQSSEGEYIGEIQLIKIHDDCSTANVISTAKGKGIAVGDTVFFSSEQIKAMDKK
jgi:hypothetical protein